MWAVSLVPFTKKNMGGGQKVLSQKTCNNTKMFSMNIKKVHKYLICGKLEVL
jgi:hypothetical protein